MNNKTPENTHQQNTREISFKEREIIICNLLLKINYLEDLQILTKTWCNENQAYSITSDGYINYSYNMQLDKFNNNFLIEIIIIIKKLKQENIIFEWKKAIPIQKNVNIAKEPFYKISINEEPLLEDPQKILFHFFTNQLYIDEKGLKRFIKNKYMTTDEIKESRDNKLYVIAIIAILVPIITTIIQITYK
ncbi:MAG: hypothetical protein JXR51_02445 [Bacteroidales bacterium]|nr:hypothetical protein [Bacteroidales bacterium]